MADGLDIYRPSPAEREFYASKECIQILAKRSRWRLSRKAFLYTLAAGDATVLMSSGVLAGEITPLGANTFGLFLLMFCSCVAILVLWAAGAYAFRSVLELQWPLVRALAPWLAVPAVVTIFSDPSVDRFAVTWATLGLIGLLLTRAVTISLARRLATRGALGSSIVIVGSDDEVARCEEAARRDPGVALVTRACPAVGIAETLRRESADAVVIALAPSEAARLPEILAILRRLPVRVLLALDRLAPGAGPAARVAEGEIQDVALVCIADRPLDGWAWATKNVVDFSFALVALVLAAPLMLTIAVCIKLSSPGPVLFRQVRQGYGGREFTIMKFRTMHVPPRNQHDDTLLVLVTPQDSRVFSFGAFLRRLSLDELPQLLNVLRGDMWLVGPRPHSPLARAAGVLYADAIGDYFARHSVKPGITGWAQVNGWRGPTDTVEQLVRRVEHDLEYIENWSPLLDIRILAATVLGGFRGKNAF